MELIIEGGGQMTSRNLKIDQSKQANIVVNSVEQYNALPHNRVDLEGYDTKYTEGEARELIEKKRFSREEQRKFKQAQAINKKRPYKELKKDLKTTENVIPITEVQQWSENPNKYDLQGIDTQPAGMIGAKTNMIRRKFLAEQVERPEKMNFGLHHLGSFYPLVNKIKLNQKFLKPKPEDYNMAYAHELGHATHFLKIGVDKKFNQEERSELKRAALKYNPVDLDKVSQRHKSYRMDTKELVADAFSGFVKEPNRFKKEQPLITKIFCESLPKVKPRLRHEENVFLNKHIKKIRGF